MERGRFAHAMEECLVNGENKEEPEESLEEENIKTQRECEELGRKRRIEGNSIFSEERKKTGDSLRGVPKNSSEKGGG